MVYLKRYHSLRSYSTTSRIHLYIIPTTPYVHTDTPECVSIAVPPSRGAGISYLERSSVTGYYNVVNVHTFNRFDCCSSSSSYDNVTVNSLTGHMACVEIVLVDDDFGRLVVLRYMGDTNLAFTEVTTVPTVTFSLI